MGFIHILRNRMFYPYGVIHIFYILKNLSIWFYPYGYMDKIYEIQGLSYEKEKNIC